MPLVAGQAVEALWPEDGEWYNAVVRAVTTTGIELDYEDGDFRADATEADIRVKDVAEDDDWLNDIIDAPDPEPEKAIEVSADMAHLDAELDDGLGDLLDDIIDEGDAVTGEPARPAPGDELVAAPGEITAAIAATKDADVSLEQDVALDDALDPRSTAAGVLQGAFRQHSARKAAQEWTLALMVGTLVEARFGGDDEWFPGIVEAVHEDGTYAIAYDDGDRGENVPRRSCGPSRSPPRPTPRPMWMARAPRPAQAPPPNRLPRLAWPPHPPRPPRPNRSRLTTRNRPTASST